MTPDLGVGSHFPVLAAALARTSGPVLECGLGWFSTPMIHLMSMGRRAVLSLETDPGWMDIFSRYASPTHRIERIDADRTEPDVHHGLIKAWETWAKNCTEHYGVVFLDQSPGEARVPMAKAMKGKALFIVCHDAEADIPPGGGNYRWRDLEGVFKYAVTWKDVRPWTTIYSDEEEFEL